MQETENEMVIIFWCFRISNICLRTLRNHIVFNTIHIIRNKVILLSWWNPRVSKSSHSCRGWNSRFIYIYAWFTKSLVSSSPFSVPPILLHFIAISVCLSLIRFHSHSHSRHLSLKIPPSFYALRLVYRLHISPNYAYWFCVYGFNEVCGTECDN